MRKRRYLERAFTLMEILVALTVFAITGAIVVELLRLNLVLHAKNLAINISHEQARNAMDRIVKDINASISVPTLTDANFNPVSPNNMCAGVSFLEQSGRVFQVTPSQTAAATQNTILITTGTGFAPTAGEWLVIPAYQVQQDITNVTSEGGGEYNLALSSTLGNAITLSSTTNVVALIADPVGYVETNGEMLYYPNTSSTNCTVIARDLVVTTGSGPFTVPADYTPPAGEGVEQDYSTVAIMLTTEDCNASNLGYNAVNTELTAFVSCNARLTDFGADGNTGALAQTAAPTSPSTPTTPAPTPDSSPSGSNPSAPTPAPTAAPSSSPSPPPYQAPNRNQWYNWW